MVPKDAVTGFSGPAPIYAPMGAGPLTLVFQARGTDSVAIPIFVTDTPDLCRVSAGIPQPPVVLDTVMESVAVFCGLTDGTPMPGVLVNSALRELVNGSCTGAKLTTSGRQSGVTGTDGVATFTDIIPVYGSTGGHFGASSCMLRGRCCVARSSRVNVSHVPRRQRLLLRVYCSQRSGDKLHG